MAQSLDSSQQQELETLQNEGKQLAAEGKLKESLKKFELAKKIFPSEKIIRRIEKLKEYLKVAESERLNTTKGSSTSSDTTFKGSYSSNINSVKKTALVEQRVLNDIQNVQDLSKSRLCSTSIDLSPTSKSKFTELKKKAKESAYNGKHEEALELFNKALSIYDCPNVKRYIQEIKLVMSNNPSMASNIEDVSTMAKEEPSTQKGDKNETSNESVQAEKNDLDRKREKVRALYEEARDLATDGELTNALKVLKKAQSIYKTEKVQKKIDKLQELISADDDDSGNDEMIKITEDFSVFHDIYNKLYPYQREGVAWMWKLFKMGKGGVLGDDMGLGKTFQVIAFISGMIDADLVKHVLIIMPVSLLQNWTREFKKWCPGISVQLFHGTSKRERERNLLKVQKRGHVLLTSYGMVVNNVDYIIKMEEREFVWDYVILDEGHKIKNPTKTTKAVYEIPSKNRLVLTGTPIQNNLKELWSLYDFVQQGTLLGSLKTFKMQYENPITRSREKDATAGEKRLGTEMVESLKTLINPYFLRRTKDEIWKKKADTDDDVEQLGSQLGKMEISRLNAKKNDLILWTYMSDPQVEIYTSFLHSEAVKSILVSKRSPLVELTTLKKICDHPRLLSQRACLQLGLDGDLQAEDLERELESESTMSSSIDNVSDETLLLESGKLKLVIQLLENLKETGHRTLVFSLSRKILDMIHRILVNRNWKVMRLDGTVTKTEERERRIQRFQKDSSYPVFLLTTQVGGVGITLTAADRVIIYDPSWNPATDAQAVDRVYRIGQEKDVVVYRLITCGSVEEKIYRRQIFKDSITRQATGESDPYRYFSKQELRELFTLDNPHYSATQVQLSEMHSDQRTTDNFLERHIHFLQTMNIFGISHHDLMFSKNIEDSSEDNDKAAISEDFIKRQVAAANQLITMEASVVAEGIRLARAYNRPYQELIPLQPKKVAKDSYKPPVLPEVIDLTENAVDVFPSEKPRSLSDDIKTSYSQEIASDRKYYSPTYPKNDNMSSVDEQEKFSSISIKEPLEKNSEQTVPTFLKQEVKDHGELDMSCKIEKLRKSLDCTEQEKFSSISIKELLEKNSEQTVPTFLKQEVNDHGELDMSCKIEKLRKSLDCTEQSDKVIENLTREGILRDDRSAEITSLNAKVDSNNEQNPDYHGYSTPLKRENALNESGDKAVMEKRQSTFHNFSQLEDDYLESEVLESVKKSRRSCARKSLMLSDNESSHRSSTESNLRDNIVEDSEDDVSSEYDSSNSASISFVPNSSPNTPEAVKLNKETDYITETPPSFEPTSLHRKELDNSFSRKFEGSVRRITPLKIDKNHSTPSNSSFVQALEAAIDITPHNSPENNNNKPTFVPPNSDLNSSIEDSPLKVTRKKKTQQITSDSEESDGEMVNITNQSGHEKNCSEEESDSCSDSDTGDYDDSVAKSRDLSGDGVSYLDRNSKHSSGSEEDISESDSENSVLVSGDEDESELSDKSGSVFGSGEGSETDDY